MQKLANWIVSHRKIILIVTAIAIVLSIVGMLFVKKNGDVISYLDSETPTIQAMEALEKEYGIVGDCTFAVSYLSEDQVGRIVRLLEQANLREYSKHYSNSNVPSAERKKVMTKLVWAGSFDDLSMLPNFDSSFTPAQIQELQDAARAKFMHTEVVDGKEVTTYIISMYLSCSGSEDRAIDLLDEMDESVSKYLNDCMKKGSIPTDSGQKTPSDYYFVGGTAQNARVLLQSSIGDMPKFFIIAVLAVFLILLVTSHSYMEPFIFLATLGLSMLFNMGSNIIAGNPIGTISSITASCAMILQLAIAMDYSIFLMHAYYEEIDRNRMIRPEDALRAALPKTMAAVSASALTTFGGFVALFFMQYGMGYDLGFVLAKGVLLSLLAVIFIQPILILMLHKPIQRLQHNWYVEVRLRPFAKATTKPIVAILIFAACLGLAIPSAYFQTKVPLNYITMTAENPDPTYPETVVSEYNNQLIIIVPFSFTDEDIARQRAFLDQLEKVGVQLDADGNPVTDENGNPVYMEGYQPIVDVLSLFSMVDDKMYDKIESSTMRDTIYKQLYAGFISNALDQDAPHSMLYTLHMQGNAEDPASIQTYFAIRDLAVQTFGTAHVTGLTAGAYELSAVTPRDFMIVNVVSVVFIYVILLFTFRKPILSLLLMLVIETGIFVNLTVIYWLGVHINFMAYLIVSAILLGATVDYAILVTTKYLEEKRNGADRIRAVSNAIYRSAPSVLTSGAILVIVCICVFSVTSNVIVAQITELIARGAGMSMALVFTLLPSILTLREVLAKQWAKWRKKPYTINDAVPDLFREDRIAFDSKHPSRFIRCMRMIGMRIEPRSAAATADTDDTEDTTSSAAELTQDSAETDALHADDNGADTTPHDAA